MPTSDIARELYGLRYYSLALGLPTVTTGATVLTNLAATAVEVAQIPILENEEIESVGVAFASATGTAPSLQVQVRRVTTVLASSGFAVAAGGTGIGVAVGSNVSAPVTKGEALNIAVLASNADNDFTNAVVVVKFEPQKS